MARLSALVRCSSDGLRIAAPDLDASQRQQPLDELRIELDDLREMLSRLVERAALLVEAAEIEPDHGVGWATP